MKGKTLRELTDYIQDIYFKNGYENEDINWALIMKQIKNIKKDYKCTEGDIYGTLYFILHFKDVNLFSDEYNGTILNLVPYYIQETRQFQNQLKENRKIKSKEDIVVSRKIKTKKKTDVPFDKLDDIWYN